MKSKNIKALQRLLSTPKNVVIIPHKNPDGDAMGSSLGWMHFLNKNNHTASVIAPNPYPYFLKWIPGDETVICFETNENKALERLEEADVICTLDFNSLDRIELLGEHVDNHTATKIMIDHHRDPQDYADLQFSEPEIGSTCELVYQIIESLSALEQIDNAIATSLYVGMLTDSGSFRFPSVTPKTHRIVAHLIECGANPSAIYNQIYNTSNVNRLQLLGQALNNLKVLPEYHAAFMTLSQEELRKFNFQKGDTEGFVNYALTIEGVKLAVIMIEDKSEQYVKLSLRSSGSFSVNEMAKKHFQGGGHINAAGGKNDGTIDDTVQKFITLLPQYQKSLQSS